MKLFKNSYIFLLSAIVLLLSSFPFMHETFFRFHDYTQVARIAEFARGWQAGHIPVQWTQNFGSGYGMPLFLFYGPLPFFLGALFTFVGFTAITALKLIFLFTNVIAFWGMYTLMKRWGRTVGFVSATAFLWAPYRALDIYVRGALNELFALSLLPWALHFGMLFLQKKRTAWLGTSFVVAAIILSHNLTAFIALPFLFAISLSVLFLERRTVKKNIGLLISAYVAGAALSAFYAFPLFFEKDFTIVDEITTGYFDFRIHFLYIRQFLTAAWGYAGSSYGPTDGISFHLGRAMLIAAGVGLTAALFQMLRSLLRKPRNISVWIEQEKTRLTILIIGICLAISLFLTLGHSERIWEVIPFLAYIQFPWRYLTLSTLFLSMLTGMSLLFIRRSLWRWAVMLVLSTSIVVTQYQYHQPEEYLQNDAEYYFTDAERIRIEASQVLYDYLPKGFNRELLPVTPEERIVFLSATPSATWQKNLPHELLLTVEATAPARIRWNIAHFPGWKYFVNGKEITPEITKDGIAEYTTPETVTSAGARFTPTPVRVVGSILSLLTLVLWLTVASIGQRGILKGKRGTTKNL